jgi:hypothetical protein
MTVQLLHSEFSYTVYEDNLIFFFISVKSLPGSTPESSVNEMTVSGEASSLVLRSLTPGQVGILHCNPDCIQIIP